jgi:haloacetate dehalogenase
MFEGFERFRLDTGGATIVGVRGGSGPPVLLLHGWPQTHVQWHAVARSLAERHTVVCTDLRGHGDSSKPPGGQNHVAYRKRAMADDQIEVMAALGFERFALVGHDRGGRVAFRLALDSPERVAKLALLDIAPTLSMLEGTDQRSATASYHIYFLCQPYDLPERLIASDPAFFLRWHLRAWSGGQDGFFHPAALAEYERAAADPAAIHANCEDVRALTTIDAADDAADRGVRRLACPLLVLWGDRWRTGDLAALWHEWCDDVTARTLHCGHFLAEEQPEQTAAALLEFLAA